MGLLRRRNHDDIHLIRYQMHERLLDIGDDSCIEDKAGDRVYKVNGMALHVRDTWVHEDSGGHEVAKIRERKLSVRDAMKIEVGGREATVKTRHPTRRSSPDFSRTWARSRGHVSS